MITISRKTFERLCAAFGIPLAEAEKSVVSSDGGYVVANDGHESFPKPKDCGCSKGVRNA